MQHLRTQVKIYLTSGCPITSLQMLQTLDLTLISRSWCEKVQQSSLCSPELEDNSLISSWGKPSTVGIVQNNFSPDHLSVP